MQSHSNSKTKIYSSSQLTPPVLCPNCAKAVRGFISSEPMRLDDDKRLTRETAMVGVPAHKLFANVNWIVFPCYCRVNQYWADDFVREMASRKAGNAPREVQGLNKRAMQAARLDLEKSIATLYDRREAAMNTGLDTQREALERELLVKINELSSLHPGAYNHLPPVLLAAKVTQWAKDQGMATPPVSDEALREAQKQVTPEKLLETLTMTAEYSHLSMNDARAFAFRVYENLQGLINHHEPLKRDAAQLLSCIVPEAHDFFYSQIDTNPKTANESLEAMMVQRKRRITRLEYREDTDDED